MIDLCGSIIISMYDFNRSPIANAMKIPLGYVIFVPATEVRWAAAEVGRGPWNSECPSVHASIQGFCPLSGKVITQLISNLVCTFIGWMFRTDSLLGDVGPILALQWPKKDWKWVKMVVSDHYLKKYSHNPIQTGGVHLNVQRKL